jgi:hypothetical protein
MSEAKKGPSFRNRVLASVVASLIAACIVSFVTWRLPGGWSKVGTWISVGWASTGHWLGGSADLPRWALALLVLLALVLLAEAAISVVILFLKRLKMAQPSEAEFNGLKWRWLWRQGDLDNIATFCPVCDMQIQLTYYVRNLPPLTVYFCDRCNLEKLKFEGKPADLTDLFTREIQRQQRQRILKSGSGSSAETMTLPEPASVPGELNETPFEDLIWRWRFRGDQIVDIDTFCPHCDFQVQPYQENPHCPTVYDCPSCRAHLKVHIGTHEDLRDRFVRLVQREARNIRRL